MKIDPRSELSAAQVSELQAKLTRAREELVRRRRRPVMGRDPLEQGEAAGDSMDQAEATYEQALSSELTDVDAHVLHEIDDALARIEGGTYGVCQGTGDPIGYDRLSVEPWARYTPAYQEEKELAERGDSRRPPTL
jgi:DnaK suppressor protein